jgi:methanogenic corrinoid protein MtbC1
LCDTDAFMRLAEVERPARWHGDLAQVVEAEIIPRLMLAHRADPRSARPEVLPTSEQIAAFTALVLSPGSDNVETQIAALVDDGLSLDSLLLDLLAPTARHLGILWEEDLCDFAELTVAVGRLQRIMHDLTMRFGGEPARHSHGRSILLLPCPGETHSFGLTLIERFFREAGWDVTGVAREPGHDPLRLARSEWYDVIGLSVGSETLLPVLTKAVGDLRRVSRNPAVRVMVGGPILTENPGYAGLVGADATAADARCAITVAESLLDLPARPC